jgi:hypothetical protein
LITSGVQLDRLAAELDRGPAAQDWADWAADPRFTPPPTRHRHDHTSGGDMKSLRVALVEDAALFREGVASLLTGAGVDIVAQTDHARGLTELGQSGSTQ